MPGRLARRTRPTKEASSATAAPTISKSGAGLKGLRRSASRAVAKRTATPLREPLGDRPAGGGRRRDAYFVTKAFSST